MKSEDGKAMENWQTILGQAHTITELRELVEKAEAYIELDRRQGKEPPQDFVNRVNTARKTIDEMTADGGEQ